MQLLKGLQLLEQLPTAKQSLEQLMLRMRLQPVKFLLGIQMVPGGFRQKQNSRWLGMLVGHMAAPAAVRKKRKEKLTQQEMDRYIICIANVQPRTGCHHK